MWSVITKSVDVYPVPIIKYSMLSKVVPCVTTNQLQWHFNHWQWTWGWVVGCIVRLLAVLSLSLWGPHRINVNSLSPSTWWRHQKETFSTLLAICRGNSPVPDEFPAQRPVTRSFDVFFDLHLNNRLSKQLWDWWFETLSCPLWRHCNEMHKIHWHFLFICNNFATISCNFYDIALNKVPMMIGKIIQHQRCLSGRNPWSGLSLNNVFYPQMKYIRGILVSLCPSICMHWCWWYKLT